MTVNVNSILGINLVDVNIAQAQTIVNVSLQGVTLGCTGATFTNYLSIPTSITPVVIPNGTAFVVYARNLGSNVIQTSYTITGGNTGTIPLSPVTNGFGGLFVFFSTVETGQGITALNFAATGGATPIELYLGG